MRIAFLGKGGSGKTTTTAGFVRYAAKKHPFIMAIDADMNVHMRHALNLEMQSELRELGNDSDEILEYLKGNRVDLADRPMTGSTPPSLKSNFIMASPNDPLIKKYAITDDNISLLSVGTYKESDIGASCYHGKLVPLAAIMHHLLDTDDDLVIADTTAGTDLVSTSLHLAYDLNVFVVEPTEKSVKVYKNFVGLAPHLTKRTYVVANKIDSDNDREFINRTIPEDRLLGMIPLSRNLKRFEQGQKNALHDFQLEQQEAFGAIYATLHKNKRDWNEYLSLLNEAHTKVSKRWLDDYYHTAMDSNLDAEFNYPRALAEELNRRQPVKSGEQKSQDLAYVSR